MWRTLHGILYRISKHFSRAGLYEALDAATNVLPAGAGVLNIGAGGEISTVLHRHPGLDILEIDADPGRSPDMVMDARDMSALENGRFDLVVAAEVLEHIPEPQRAVDEMRRVLRPGGAVFASAPFVFGIHDAPDDHQRFTRHGLEHLFRDFDAVNVRERNDFVHTIIVLVARLLMAESRRDRVFGAAAFTACLALYPLLWPLSRIINTRQVTTGYVLTAHRKDTP